MHWGDNLDAGSEHLVDGQAYAAELHFVNWNHTLYPNPEKACTFNNNDGLVVLAKFVKVKNIQIPIILMKLYVIFCILSR